MVFLVQELLGGGYRDLALSFCRLRRLAPSKADALAERLEFLTRRLPAKGEVVAKAKAKAKAGRLKNVGKTVGNTGETRTSLDIRQENGDFSWKNMGNIGEIRGFCGMFLTNNTIWVWK